VERTSIGEGGGKKKRVLCNGGLVEKCEKKRGIV